jgi:hypothetical protein
MGYFRNSFLVAGAGLTLGAFLGWETSHSWTGALSTMFIVAVLAILEVSLSFDNAVVNAVVLKKITPVWRRRFVTWGIAIAVFGMRIVFPLVIVAIITRIDPISANNLFIIAIGLGIGAMFVRSALRRSSLRSATIAAPCVRGGCRPNSKRWGRMKVKISKNLPADRFENRRRRAGPESRLK